MCRVAEGEESGFCAPSALLEALGHYAPRKFFAGKIYSKAMYYLYPLFRYLRYLSDYMCMIIAFLCDGIVMKSSCVPISNLHFVVCIMF